MLGCVDWLLGRAAEMAEAASLASSTCLRFPVARGKKGSSLCIQLAARGDASGKRGDEKRLGAAMMW